MLRNYKSIVSIFCALFAAMLFAGCSTSTPSHSTATTADSMHSPTYNYFMTYAKTIFKISSTPISYRCKHGKWPTTRELITANQQLFAENIDNLTSYVAKNKIYHMRFKLKSSNPAIQNTWIEVLITPAPYAKRCNDHYMGQLIPVQDSLRIIMQPHKQKFSAVQITF